ncbi:hypothetical protein K504DRAFT_497757 [Pleomassaria siparia CBS 279.74]|uniref:Uncharacterized protein n=1 Tax=Pleomassaria siparia CBS 279.74 TaxID=1314801 RepID=A0A6G1KKK4_9PLEO|nr:hypothetical protein K504DRAFT_497757 [Pleomassaria siparia CBS 279.74]
MSATASQRANMSTSNTPSNPSPRRVLGDLTPKAINTPTKQAYAHDPLRPHSPLKQVQTLSPQLFKGLENMPPVGVFNTGRKRSIYEVDGVDVADNAGRMSGNSIKRGTPITAAALREHTVRDSDPPHGSPTEANTPSEHHEHEHEHLELPDNSQDTQASKVSFSVSEYVDWGENSQPCVVEPPETSIPEPAKKKLNLELLRLGLGIAAYKIKTGQTGTRGKDIISKWETSTSSTAATATYGEFSTSQPFQGANSPEPRYIYANLDPGRPIGKLGAGPVLLPTAVSSRMIYDHPSTSLPPTSIAPEQLLSPVQAMSNYRTRVPEKIRTIHEDYEDEEGEQVERDRNAEEEHLHLIRDQRFEEGDLMGSAVKGHAAKGLLELMSSRQ